VEIVIKNLYANIVIKKIIKQKNPYDREHVNDQVQVEIRLDLSEMKLRNLKMVIKEIM
jgi:hypothetical protein